VANISSYTINDIALYYHALICVKEPLDSAVAQERIRVHLIDYIEQRRAALSLPPLRTQIPTLGEKALNELRQMNFVTVEDGKVRLLPAGAEIASQLTTGNGRNARRLILGRMIDTFDNVYGLIKKLSPAAGKDIVLPMPKGPNLSSDAMDASDVDLRGEITLDLAQVCKAWTDWCATNTRLDLLPDDFLSRARHLSVVSKDRKIGSRIKNVVQQLVLEQATDGIVSKMPIYRTLRDRLSSAGAINSRIRAIDSSTIALECVYSCLHIGPLTYPDSNAWIQLDVPRSAEPILVHEPEPQQIADRLFSELRIAASTLVPRAGYYRIYELRDRICEALRISQGVFDSAFLYIYRSKQGEISLGVDYETITAKRLPIEVREHGRSEFLNLLAFRQPIQEVRDADHS